VPCLITCKACSITKAPGRCRRRPHPEAPESPAKLFAEEAQPHATRSAAAAPSERAAPAGALPPAGPAGAETARAGSQAGAGAAAEAGRPRAEAEAASALGADDTSAGDRWALAGLAASGEEVEGRVRLPQYLLLARALLLPPLGARLVGA